MKVFVISAHPDDLEISCAGTLKRLKDQGADITSVITVKPSEEINTHRNKDVVAEELERSYAISKFNLRILDTDLHSNGRPNLISNNNTMTKLGKLLEPCDVAIIPSPQDYHQDHKNTYSLAWPLVQKLAKEIWLMNSYPYCLNYRKQTANLHYDITNEWIFKQSLLECYSSYFSNQDIEKIIRCNQWFGLTAGSDLAEAFTIVKKNVGYN
jgi:LmbE family N-acetylglucosaminyl deacetylase